jgi:hypothetical protein
LGSGIKHIKIFDSTHMIITGNFSTINGVANAGGYVEWNGTVWRTNTQIKNIGGGGIYGTISPLKLMITNGTSSSVSWSTYTTF